MQMETALSTTEAAFITLSEGLRTAIPVMNFIDELREEKVILPRYAVCWKMKKKSWENKKKSRRSF